MERRTLLSVVLLLVVGFIPAAGADPLPGGQEGLQVTNDGAALATGPASPGLAWVSDSLGERDWDRHTALSLDSAGHVLVQVNRRNAADVRVESLVAIDTTDGSLAWELDDIDNGCDVAATDDGIIFAQLVANSPTAGAGNPNADLVAIDAETGALVPGMRYSPPETAAEPRLLPCQDGLRLLPDEAVTMTQRVPGPGRVRAFSTAGGTISQDWMRTHDGTDAPVATDVLGRVIGTADGSRILTAWVDDAAPRRTHVDALDPATGALLDTTTVPGEGFEPGNAGGDAFLIDREGGVVVSTSSPNAAPRAAHLTRLDLADLSQDWSIDMGDDDVPFGAATGFSSLVAIPGAVTGFYGSSPIVAIDTDDGSVAWSVAPDSFSNNEGRIVVDGNGNSYWSTFGGSSLQSAGPDGTLRWSLPSCALGFGEARAVGPIDDDGTLYTLARQDVDGDDALHVFAIRQDGPLPAGDCPDAGQRLSGGDRFDTAIDISRSAYPEDGSADAVVLARADVFADGLAGTPLAVQENGPVLITETDRLLPAVAAEITRLLGNDTSKTVHLLGGTTALSSAVESAVDGLGYRSERVAGGDRIQTAIEIATSLDRVDAFLVTTGYNFPDALAAGPAAVKAHGAVLLTVPDARAPATDAFMDARDGVARYAIGGPAARAYPEATAVQGPDRVATAVAVARRFFDAPPVAGLARLDTFPDSLTGGAHIATGTPELARQGGPMLLTASTQLLDPVADYLCDAADSLQRVYVYGGEAAVTGPVADASAQRIAGTGC